MSVLWGLSAYAREQKSSISLFDKELNVPVIEDETTDQFGNDPLILGICSKVNIPLFKIEHVYTYDHLMYWEIFEVHSIFSMNKAIELMI